MELAGARGRLACRGWYGHFVAQDGSCVRGCEQDFLISSVWPSTREERLGWIVIILGALTAWRIERTSHPLLFWLAIAATFLTFYSFGIMHNASYRLAANRRQRLMQHLEQTGASREEIADLDRRPIRIASRETEAAPDWATLLNAGSSLPVLALFCISWFL